MSVACAVIYVVPLQMSETWKCALLGIDGPIGLTIVIGATKVAGCSFFQLLGVKTKTV